MVEHFSDLLETTATLDAEGNRTTRLGGVLTCFANLLGSLVPNLKQDAETPWEVSFTSLQDLTYLGSGSQGVVYGGRLNGEIVAVKKVLEKGETNIRHLRKLKHENIVRFRGICTEAPNFCVIMEYCQYGSLFDFLHNGSNLLPNLIMKWAKEIAFGLDYLHSKQIIHRDLKSSNVLVADNLVVKVSDFGTSREWEGVSTVMSFKGTVAWMAPEMIRHDPCSEKVDVWSFGVVLWEMITRQVPFKGFESHSVMWVVGSDSLSLPIPTQCPCRIQHLLRQTWNRVPKERPTFKDIAADLEVASPDFAAIKESDFARKQIEWGAEVGEAMDKLFGRGRRLSTSASTAASPLAGVAASANAAQPRDELREVKHLYEQQVDRANELYMEVVTVRLRLEERELQLVERENLLRACRCSQRNALNLRQQTSQSSSSDRSNTDNRNRPPAQMLVNYVDRDEGLTYTVAVNECQCDNTAHNNCNPQVKETCVERNGNVTLQTKSKTKHAVVPDVAHV